MKNATNATARFRGLVDGFCETVLTQVGKDWTPFCPSSLKEMEMILQTHNRLGTVFGERPILFTSLGVYLGEVIRRDIGDRCWWTMEEGQPVLIVAGPRETLKLKPVVRIAKALKNPAYQIEAFATYAIGIGQGTSSFCSSVDEEACADS
jgi:hypothetical protein